MRKRALIVIVLAAVVAAALAFWHRDDEGPAGPGVTATAQQVKRGEYLVRAANCYGCHTRRGEAPYAGGVAIATPFGAVFSSNITPDPETGIGAWSADDFWTAVHKGKSRDGSYLYPAFPFPNYTRLLREDVDAMYAYLRTLAPVRRANQPHDLRFPYNRRGLMVVWRALYFRPGVHRDDAKQSAEVNRGRYLVQGAGHCNACHASRNVLGAVESEDFSGALLPAQTWYAPALSSLGKWESGDLTAFLRAGVSQRAASYGPMSAVIRHSLQYLTPAEARAMAAYLKSQVQDEAAAASGSAMPERELARMMKHGALIYERHCVDCHKANGEGVPRAYPALAGNTSILADVAVNPVRMVYSGGFPPSTQDNPRPYGMPPFYQDLSDDDVAAVVTYIRRSWGNNARPVSQAETARLRGIPND